MISSEEIVTIAFRILNFGVLLFGLKYVYTHYIAQAAQDDIEADEKKVAVMAQQKGAFFHQEQFIKQEIQAQQKLVAHLTGKLEQWRAAAQKTQEDDQAEHNRLEEALCKKAAEQSEHIAQYMLERRALPEAVRALELSLENHFKDEKRQTAYLGTITDYMDKDR